MKITKIYSESSEIEDSSKDKVIITLSVEEYVELTTNLGMIGFAESKVIREKAKDFLSRLENANKKRKIKWVK